MGHANANPSASAQEESSVTSREGSGEIIRLPNAQPPAVTDGDKNGVVVASRVWLAEARETATSAIDGSVWRQRPPSLRDLHARVQRAEWAGDIPVLRLAGQAFGYLSLALTATGYGLLWIVRRPLRLTLAATVLVLLVVLAF